MTADPFDTLRLAPVFDLDREAIERAYLGAAAGIHPDLAAGDPEAPGRMAALNEARGVLENPETRADALLRRLGGPSKEEERGLPEGFLADMMETRERIEDALAKGADRPIWEQWARDQREHAVRDVVRLFAEAGPSPDLACRRAIRVRLNAWRYIERLIEQLDPGYADTGEAQR